MVRLINSSKVITDAVKVGLDPEFLLFDKQGGFVPANVVLGGDSINEDVGVDECNNTGELRPQEGTPAKVVKNTATLLSKLGRVIKQRELLVYAGASVCVDEGDGDSDIDLGGHIHFNIPYCGDFVTALDAFIGRPMLRMRDSDRRTGDEYGELSEWESKAYGFEYRTPPSFIGKPDLFAGVIAVAYCVARTWVAYKKEIGNTWEYNTEPSIEDYQKLVCYKRYAKEIEGFLSYVNERKSIEEYNVLAAWEINTVLPNVRI